MNIFVGSLPFRIEESELQEIFEEYGEVSSVKIITDKFSGRSKGFGFVEMPNEEEAKKAVEELNGAEIDGRTIVVNESEKRDTPRRSGFGGGAPRGDNPRGGGGGGFNKGGGGFNKGGFNKGGTGGGNRRGGERRQTY